MDYPSILGLFHNKPYKLLKATAPRQVKKGGALSVNFVSSFLLSVLASVIAYYICKWLDRK